VIMMKYEKIKEFLKTGPIMHLASISNNQPRLSPMGTLYIDNKLWIATLKGRNKIKEFEKNQNFEFSINWPKVNNPGLIRGRGKAIIIDDRTIKKKISEKIEWFKDFYKSYEDDKFILYELQLEELFGKSPEDRSDFQFTF